MADRVQHGEGGPKIVEIVRLLFLLLELQIFQNCTLGEFKNFLN